MRWGGWEGACEYGSHGEQKRILTPLAPLDLGTGRAARNL